MRTPRPWLAPLVGASLVLGACSSARPSAGPTTTPTTGAAAAAATSTSTTAAAPPPPARRPARYVAVGASESVGVGADDPATQAWPRVLARTGTAIPKGTPVDVVGVSGSTTAEALAQQLPRAEQLQPTVVTVWLNVNDIFRLVPAATYEDQLGQLVGRLRQGGTATVAVANVPLIDELPVVVACRPGAPAGPVRCPVPEQLRSFVFGPTGLASVVDAYNAAIARVVAREGAILVDLKAASAAARAAGTAASLVSKDGFHPSTAGHAAIAATFAAALTARR